MLQSCKLKNALQKAEGPSFGFWQTLPGANVSRTLARAGADWVLVDCEHGNIDGMILTAIK
jgi:4-hydroxy-2-oxoheptanedioate aldolase